ncbi:hypothetical protein IFM89_016162 [Coptis chinensis]|uniref:Uncharacterized protein n=1 Tax=Coptis chinensis TaxID=261450 RepID=A0A835LMS1_9MAGN|nr:hypothetical protein IFM89_016162 [Coptis chinensis]
MSNLMKVLGSEATQDPTKLEMEIHTVAAEREQAHVDRNIARKLTPAERHEKKERKLFEDPNTLETIVSVYKINDLSHPQTHFKVDVNAQENRLTGCAVMADLTWLWWLLKVVASLSRVYIVFQNQFGEAQAKELKTKQAQLAKAKSEPDINPNLIEVSERVITREKSKDSVPDVEWW